MSLLKKHYGSVVFVCLGLMTIPQLFFQSNSAEFGGDLLLVFLPIASAAIALAILYALPGRLIQTATAQGFLSALGVAIVVSDALFRAPLGPLDGATPDFTMSNATRFGSLAVFIVLPIAGAIAAHKLRTLFTDLAPVVGLLAIGLTGYSVFLSSKTVAPQITQPTPTKVASTATKLHPNVYLIWLDALETGYAQRFFESPKNRLDYSGFTHFENNSSNYLYTLQSYASFMSGTLYRNGDYDSWFAKSDRLRQQLKSLNYNITTYAKSDFLSKLDNKQIEAAAMFAERNEARHPFVADFVTYWLTRSLPAAVASTVFASAQNAGNQVHSFANPGQQYANVKTISDGIEPLSGVFTLEQLTADEAGRQNTGELVIAQAVIPHGPYVIDSQCNYRGKSKSSPTENYYEQLECAMQKTSAFLQELKRLDRFDGSIIIIMGDHGSGWAGLIGAPDSASAPPLNARYTPWTSSMVAGRASAGLLIKPAARDAESKLEQYTKDSQLIDVYPTVLTLLGERNKIEPDVEGQPLFTENGNPTPTSVREKFFTYFQPSKVLNLLEAEIYDLSQSDRRGFDVKLRGPFRSAAEMPSVECGVPVSFGRIHPDAEYYRSNGLSGIESWGRWSMSRNADITFRMSETGCDLNTLSISARGFVLAAHKSQSATVSLNGRPIGTIQFQHAKPNQRTHTFSVPEDALTPSSLNRLEFEFQTPQSPKAIGLSTDSRLLGLGFESLQVD